jgi:ribose-phosphate pyrophosphokinase
MAANLDLDFALFHKERKKTNEIARMVLVGNVEGKTAILIDDMADTCGTLALAAKHLLAGGAKTVLALVTHGILSGKAMKVLNESNIEKLIVTNSIPQHNVRLPFIPLHSLLVTFPSPPYFASFLAA